MNIIQMSKLIFSQGLLNIMAFLNDWQASIRMYFLYSGLECGLFKALRTPASKETLVSKLSPKGRDFFEALLDVGVTTGELSFKNGLYRLRGRRSKALADDSDEIFTGIVQANVTYYHRAFLNAAERLKGAPLTDLLGTYAEVVARFSRSSEPFILDFLHRRLNQRKDVRLLEIGCGSGVHLRSVRQINPHVSGIGIDMDPHVATQARENIAKWGLSDRFQIMAGDIRRPPDEIDGTFDIITLFNLIYYFDEAERRDLFCRISEMLSVGGEFLIVTMVTSKGRDPIAAALNFTTIADKGTHELPDEATLIDQLGAAGFCKVKMVKLIPRSAFFGFIARKKGH